MNRRKFIEKSCLACGAIVVGSTILSLESCSASKGVQATPVKDGYISLALSDFKEERIKLVNTTLFKANILVVKNPDNTFHAVLMKCTHRGGTLKLEGSANLRCIMHGSLFTYHGNVLMGPAKEPLQHFSAEVLGEEVKVKLV
jgi:nitrite reductase/ring-hydroxylating ferredoxin subunit